MSTGDPVIIICSCGPPCSYYNYGICNYIGICKFQRPLREDGVYRDKEVGLDEETER